VSGTTILDTAGNPLEVGAMYACVTIQNDADRGDEEYERFDALVRYAGDGEFLDADTLEECDPDFDKLHRQVGPVIDLSKVLS
jgi:hypothetical protein